MGIGRVMVRLVLWGGLVVGLSACQFAPVTDDSSPRSRLAPGSLLVLHEPLVVPVGHARVFLQAGAVVSKRQLDTGLPHCNFELTTLSDAPQVIRPGRFTITAVHWDEEWVVHYGPPGWRYTDSDGADNAAPLITRLLHHRLAAAQQPELMRLTCHGGFDDPWYAQFPSVRQIRQALGEWVTIEPPAGN